MRSSRARFLKILEEQGKRWFPLKVATFLLFFKKPRFFKLFLKVEVFFCDVLICEKPLKFLVFMKAEPESGF